jgi:demethylmenaquinone methyltransferase/2-methoxy-6-polyprenyl-1,4-benzoquinol methylase
VSEPAGVVVVGAGVAGLAVSRELTEAGIAHVVLEPGRVGQTWRGRWDSFCLVTPNWSVQLPRRHYAAESSAPVREGVAVTSLQRGSDGGFRLETSAGPLAARSVVLATGAYQRPRRPRGAATLPADLLQIDVEDYRNPADLARAPVLVVGSGQSGCQFAEEFHEAGRSVFSLAGGPAGRHAGSVATTSSGGSSRRGTVASYEDPMSRRDESDPLLAEQVAYYRAIAPEYEDHAIPGAGEDELIAALDAFQPTGDVLELACGPGAWTERLLHHATNITAVDAAPEMLARAKARVGEDRVRFIQADLFAWTPDRRYDVVFFSSWISHVPLDRFDAFWSFVTDCLRPAGRVFFIDDAYRTPDELIEGQSSSTIRRRLNDGTAYRAVKVPHRPADLEDRLRRLGWQVRVTETSGPCYWGQGMVDRSRRREVLAGGPR